jgi:hypothetical protein
VTPVKDKIKREGSSFFGNNNGFLRPIVKRNINGAATTNRRKPIYNGERLS